MIDNLTTYIPTDRNESSIEKQAWVACLIVLNGPEVGGKIPLDKDEIIIGRSTEADLCLNHRTVSRRHARILCKNGQYRITDLASTNGLRVNDSPCSETDLIDKDQISIGEYLLKFVASDSSEQHYYQEIYRQAYMDKYLQIYNKHYFLLRMDEELACSQQKERYFSLLMFDADHFKRFNDTYGHLAGDAVLVHVVNVVKKNLRKADVLCRYGGEEFAVILPDTGNDQAYVVAENLRKVIATSPVEVGANKLAVTVSIGVTTHMSGSCKHCCEELIRQADIALYQAKNQGRNRVEIYRNAA